MKGLAEIAGRAVDLLKREVSEELRRTFGLWIRKLFNRRKVDIPLDVETMTGQPPSGGQGGESDAGGKPAEV